ncbi:hypothetical protein P1X14_17820 [Sphingomonas sp. AOB5]|uniref:hypothetical protein n=1 Tax=Sphingomonas sp. AOB5 TaxID=3034017 RepID=UPI0023F877B6|nr:hypothetical protein [Sphingomonas sp. AOB5]MDF7777121.1 hypothetical protein [Sphingomonas sp. AOB5]
MAETSIERRLKRRPPARRRVEESGDELTLAAFELQQTPDFARARRNMLVATSLLFLIAISNPQVVKFPGIDTVEIEGSLAIFLAIGGALYFWWDYLLEFSTSNCRNQPLYRRLSRAFRPSYPRFSQSAENRKLAAERWKGILRTTSIAVTFSASPLVEIGEHVRKNLEHMDPPPNDREIAAALDVALLNRSAYRIQSHARKWKDKLFPSAFFSLALYFAVHRIGEKYSITDIKMAAALISMEKVTVAIMAVILGVMVFTLVERYVERSYGD